MRPSQCGYWKGGGVTVVVKFESRSSLVSPTLLPALCSSITIVMRSPVRLARRSVTRLPARVVHSELAPAGATATVNTADVNPTISHGRSAGGHGRAPARVPVPTVDQP